MALPPSEATRRDMIGALRLVKARVPVYGAHKGTVAAGQTTVPLAQGVAAARPYMVSLYVGGARQAPGLDYTTDGSNRAQLTWVPDADLDTLAIHEHAANPSYAIQKAAVAAGETAVVLGQPVAADAPFLVSLYVGGVRQAPGQDFITDGSDRATLTWVPDAALDTLAIHDHLI